MKRSHSSAEVAIVRKVVPKTSNDAKPLRNPAPVAMVPVPSAEPNATDNAPMAFPGPYAYVPRPAAMEDGESNPGSASSASNVREGSGQGVMTLTFPAAGRSQNRVEPALAAAASTSVSSSTSSTESVASADNPNGYPPLIHAAFTGDHAALAVLLRDTTLDIHQRDPKSGMSALCAAAVGGHVEMLHRLIAAGADVDLRPPHTGVTDLMVAAARNMPDVVTHLLAVGAKVNLVVPEQRLTALMLAAGKGHIEVVKKLVAHKDIALDQADVEGRSALYWATKNNKPEVVECLVEAGAKVNLVAGKQRLTALALASLSGHVEVVEKLVAHKDIDLDQTDVAGRGALHWAAEKNKFDVVACLLAAGAKVNLVSGEQRRTALILAALIGHVDVVKKLVGHKDIALDQTDVQGCSALHIATAKNKPDVLQCLLAAGAKVNLVVGQQRRTALMLAAVNGQVEIVEKLVARKDIVLDQTDVEGRSALYWAASRNMPDVVACLAAAGAKVDLVVGQRRLTALMLAALNGHVDVVEKLVAHKNIALDQPDAGGKSALHWAAENNKPDVVACLLAGGASMTQVDDFRQTAQTYAIRNKHAAVLEVLVSYGADVSGSHYFDPDPTAFDVTLADLDADRKSPANPERNPLGLLAPASLDQPIAVIDELLAALDPKPSLYPWLKAKGIRKACALPVVECLASLDDTWPVLANGGRSVSAHQKRLICAAALSRLSVLTAEGKALAHYKAAGISAASIARLSAVATRQIDKLIAVAEQLLTTMGDDMLEKLVPACLSRIGLDNQADTATLSADLVSAGWIKPLAQVIAKSWKSALATLEAEPLAIATGSTVQQITQRVLMNTERKAPRYFAQAMQRELAAPTLPAALRTWMGNARPTAALEVLFQIQSRQLRQYCEQIVSAG